MQKQERFQSLELTAGGAREGEYINIYFTEVPDEFAVFLQWEWKQQPQQQKNTMYFFVCFEHMRACSQKEKERKKKSFINFII